MRYQRFLFVVLVGLVAAACASSPRTVRTEFEDIPVPRGLSLLEDRTTIIESPSVKAARLLYRGRIEINSLALAMRTTLEANGWRSVSNTAAGKHGFTQVYEKANNSLQVRLWEEWFFTYVEFTASHAVQASQFK